MPGYEVIGEEEREAINKIFTESGGVLYRYGFDAKRNNIFRVKEFEQQFAQRMGAKYAIAVTSGSAALKICLQALGIGPGDEVITQSHTFIATVEAIREVGAKAVIADIDETLNMDPSSLADLITENTKCIIPVHMSGVACRMEEIMQLANETNIPVLEDNAQSPGGTYGNYCLGTIGDLGIFSLDFGKMLTTGEGGMIVTNDDELYKICKSISDHGHADNPDKPRGEDDCSGFGFNYKMTEIQGAIGLAQIAKLDSIIQSHVNNKNRILNEISNNETFNLRTIPNEGGDIGDSISLIFSTQGDALRFVDVWKEAGFGTKNLPDALKWHFAWYWRHMKFYTDDLLRQSYDILSRTVAIPINIKMTDEDINKMITTINNFK